MSPPEGALRNAGENVPVIEDEAAHPAGTEPAARRRWRPRRPTRRSLVRWGAGLVVAGLVVAGATIPVNKVIESPGPTWNVLASADSGSDVLTVSGTSTYAATGALRMTTVSVRGCPGYPVSFFEVVAAWLSTSNSVIDRDLVCPSSLSEQQVDAVNTAQMTSSQSAAVVAALMESGLATSMSLTVEDVSDEQSSSGLEKGDVLKAITPQGGTRTEITTYTALRTVLTGTAPGTRVSLEVERGSTTKTLTLTTLAPSTSGTEGSLLGVYLSAHADSDVSATFGLEDVGGPSAGMMFALGIVDEVTPGSMTGGKDIAGTGTIAIDGSVGAIGGIEQKMEGAKEAGSTSFLAPESNCSEVVGHEPAGLSVYAVSTLHEAVTAVQAIAAGDTSGLRTCEQVEAAG